MVMTGQPDSLTRETPTNVTHHGLASTPDALQRQDQAIQAWAWLPESAPSSMINDGPLSGLHFGVKDIIDVRGMPTHYGAALPENDTPRAFDAVVVAQLRQAGAIPVGKTVTAEYAFVTPGPTANPWNLAHTPGGSSSGSAAAVAAGMVPMALGTQTGGSVIRPAAFNGVIGFKPSFGRIHRGGMAVLCESLDTIGWFTRDLALARKVFDVLLPGHVTSSHPPATPPRIALLPCHKVGTLSPHALQALEHAAERIREFGGTVDLHEPDENLARLVALHSDISAYELARGMLPMVQVRPQALSQAIRDTIKRGLDITAQHYQDCMQERAVQQALWQQHFVDYDALLTPSSPGEAPKGLHSTGSSIFNRPWSLLGWPCLHLPTTTSPTGLPLGVQLVSLPGRDDSLLALGETWHDRLDQRSAEQRFP